MNKPSKQLLTEYNVLYLQDTDFAAHARLLQSKWRVSKGYKANDSERYKYGNFLDTELAKNEKVNFLTPEIRELVTKKITKIRKEGGLISEPRIWINTLSSQPLCFNLFGQLCMDLDLATKYFQTLFPEKVSSVLKIKFEYSTRRNRPDSSAFDVYVEYINKVNKKSFFGIEVKYQENLYEESPKKASLIFDSHQKEYTKLTTNSNFYKPNAIEYLQKVPLSQIWRDHLLAFNMTEENISGDVIFLYPFENKECNIGITSYKQFLISENEEITKFYPRDLFVFIHTLNKLHNVDWTKELVQRYLGE